MKKYFGLIILVVMLFLVTGCGKNEVTCHGEYNDGGVNIVADVVAELDDSDKVSGVTMIFDLKDSELLEQVCDSYKQKMEATDGVKVSCSGTKITVKGYENIEEDLIGITKDDFIKGMKSEQFTCE